MIKIRKKEPYMGRWKPRTAHVSWRLYSSRWKNVHLNQIDPSLLFLMGIDPES
jgi:hypothetical protein